MGLPCDGTVLLQVKRGSSGSGVLVVLTGDANDDEIPMCGCEYQVILQWTHDHHSNPTWMAKMLMMIAEAFKKNGAGRVYDVLGLSRGAQSLLRACDTRDGRPLSIEHIFLAGGCIWQRQDRDSCSRVLAGLKLAQDRRKDFPITALVSSRVDGVVQIRGNYSTRKKKHRVD